MSPSLVSLFLLLVFTGSLSSHLADLGRKELRNVADEKPLMQSGRPNRSNFIDPSKVVSLSWQPRVFLYRNFLSTEECNHLISLAQATKEIVFRTNDDSGRALANRLLKSSEISLDIEDEMVTRIEERLAAWTFLPKENSKPLKVVHYGLEEEKQRLDYHMNLSTLGSSEALVATVVLYLSNVSRGGQIRFPMSETARLSGPNCSNPNDDVKPVKGNAILFFTRKPNGYPDKSSSHSRCPVIEGDLWCATKIFQVKDTNMIKGLDRSDEIECTDEDASCPEWAALGECQRNPVFMVGSPDYFGTCMKSCHAC